MNDITTFWPAWWSGFGIGLLVAGLAFALFALIFAIALADRQIDEVPDKLEGVR